MDKTPIYVRHLFGMVYYRIEVSKEEHDEYTALPYKEAEELFLERYGRADWVNGYGFYGIQPLHSATEGKYYVEYHIGDSCD